jgi:hypothetical protein
VVAARQEEILTLIVFAIVIVVARRLIVEEVSVGNSCCRHGHKGINSGYGRRSKKNKQEL